MEAIIGGVAAASLIGSPILVAVLATWIVGPVDKAAAAHRAPPHFYMIDALAFVALFQLALALPSWLLRVGLDEYAWLIGALIVGAAAAFWIGAIRSLSRAGVSDAMRRAVFILYVLRLAGGGAFIIGGLLWASAASLARDDVSASILYAIALAVAIAALFVARHLTTWVLNGRSTTGSEK